MPNVALDDGGGGWPSPTPFGPPYPDATSEAEAQANLINAVQAGAGSYAAGSAGMGITTPGYEQAPAQSPYSAASGYSPGAFAPPSAPSAGGGGGAPPAPPSIASITGMAGQLGLAAAGLLATGARASTAIRPALPQPTEPAGFGGGWQLPEGVAPRRLISEAEMRATVEQSVVSNQIIAAAQAQLSQMSEARATEFDQNMDREWNNYLGRELEAQGYRRDPETELWIPPRNSRLTQEDFQEGVRRIRDRFAQDFAPYIETFAADWQAEQERVVYEAEQQLAGSQQGLRDYIGGLPSQQMLRLQSGMDEYGQQHYLRVRAGYEEPGAGWEPDPENPGLVRKPRNLITHPLDQRSFGERVATGIVQPVLSAAEAVGRELLPTEGEILARSTSPEQRARLEQELATRDIRGETITELTKQRGPLLAAREVAEDAAVLMGQAAPMTYIIGAISEALGGPSMEDVTRFGVDLLFPTSYAELGVEAIPGIGELPEMARASRLVTRMISELPAAQAAVRMGAQAADYLIGPGVVPEPRVLRVAVRPEAITPYDDGGMAAASGAVRLTDPAGARILQPGEPLLPGELEYFHGTAVPFTGPLRANTSLIPSEAEAWPFAEVGAKLDAKPPGVLRQAPETLRRMRENPEFGGGFPFGEGDEAQQAFPQQSGRNLFGEEVYQTPRQENVPLEEQSRLVDAPRNLERAVEDTPLFSQPKPPPDLTPPSAAAAADEAARVPEAKAAVEADGVRPIANSDRFVEVPIERITHRPDLMQARQVDPGKTFSQKHVDQLAQAKQLRRQNNPDFDFDPPVVAPDPDRPGNYVMISGHHREELWRQEGRKAITVRVDDVDLNDPEAIKNIREEAMFSNLHGDLDLPSKIQHVTALSEMGRSIADIAQGAGKSVTEIQQAADIGLLPQSIIEHAAQSRASANLAAEIGRGVRAYGIAPADTQALYQRLVLDVTDQPTPTALRNTIDLIGREMEAAKSRQGELILEGDDGQLPGFRDTKGGFMDVLADYTRKMDELNEQLRAEKSAINTFQRGMKRGTYTEADVATAVRKSQAKITTLQSELMALEVDASRAARGLPPVEPEPGEFPPAVEAAPERPARPEGTAYITLSDGKQVRKTELEPDQWQMELEDATRRAALNNRGPIRPAASLPPDHTTLDLYTALVDDMIDGKTAAGHPKNATFGGRQRIGAPDPDDRLFIRDRLIALADEGMVRIEGTPMVDGTIAYRLEPVSPGARDAALMEKLRASQIQAREAQELAAAARAEAAEARRVAAEANQKLRGETVDLGPRPEPKKIAERSSEDLRKEARKLLREEPRVDPEEGLEGAELADEARQKRLDQLLDEISEIDDVELDDLIDELLEPEPKAGRPIKIAAPRPPEDLFTPVPVQESILGRPAPEISPEDAAGTPSLSAQTARLQRLMGEGGPLQIRTDIGTGGPLTPREQGVAGRLGPAPEIAPEQAAGTPAYSAEVARLRRLQGEQTPLDVSDVGEGAAPVREQPTPIRLTPDEQVTARLMRADLLDDEADRLSALGIEGEAERLRREAEELRRIIPERPSTARVSEEQAQARALYRYGQQRSLSSAAGIEPPSFAAILEQERLGYAAVAAAGGNLPPPRYPNYGGNRMFDGWEEGRGIAVLHPLALFAEILGSIPRELMSMLDFSAVLRQGLVPTVAHPFTSTFGTALQRERALGNIVEPHMLARGTAGNVRVFGEQLAEAVRTGQIGAMFQGALPKMLEGWVDLIKNDKQMFEAIASNVGARHRAYKADFNGHHGLFRPETPDAYWSSASNPTQREEMFQSNILGGIPVFNRLRNASAGAFNLYLAKQRDDLFDNWFDTFEATTGHAPKMKQANDIARWLNISSGRGELGPLEALAPELATGLFAPRFVASRAETPVAWLWITSHQGRMRIATDLVRTMGTIGSLAYAASHIPGVDIELDPRSSDWGKLRIGDQRLDLWGGYQQIGRYAAQIATGQRKASDDSIDGVSQWDSLGRLLLTKAAPTPSMAYQIITKRDFNGRELERDVPGLGRLLLEHLVPMFAQDLVDAVRMEGWRGLLIGLPGILGASSTAYPKSTGELLNLEVQKLPADMRMRSEASGGGVHKRWWEMPDDQQNRAEREVPEIARLLEKQREEGKARGQTVTSQAVERQREDMATAWNTFATTGNGRQYREDIANAMDAAKAVYDLTLKQQKEPSRDRQLVDDYFTFVGQAKGAGDAYYEERDRLDAEWRRRNPGAEELIDRALQTSADPQYENLKANRAYLDEHYWTPRDTRYQELYDRAPSGAPIKQYTTYSKLLAAVDDRTLTPQQRAQAQSILSSSVQPAMTAYTDGLRARDPATDARLYVYGYVDTVISQAAADMVLQWAAYHGVRMERPKLKIAR